MDISLEGIQVIGRPWGPNTSGKRYYKDRTRRLIFGKGSPFRILLAMDSMELGNLLPEISQFGKSSSARV